MARKTTKTTAKRSQAGSGEAVKVSEQVDEIVSRVGQKIMSLRREQGLSLQQLAAKSDVSAAAIHKIERSGMVPTITTLLKLSNALGFPVDYFVQDEEAEPEPVHHTSGSDRPTVYTPHKGLNLWGITGPYQQFQTAAAFARMSPGATSGKKMLKHPGEELVHVTAGEVVFQIGGREYTVKAGDSIHFSGEVPHQWANPTQKPAEMIWVVLRNGA